MTVEQYHEAGARLLQCRRVLLLSHDRPDGDALGALAAMRAILEMLGRSATAGIYDVVPARYAFLEHAGSFRLLSKPSARDLDLEFDGILILDTCSWAQLEPASAFLRETRLPKLIVDHHATREELASAGSDAYYLIDTTASAVCTILHEWAQAMGWPVQEQAAVALFTGIATDTGWFRFSNTDPRTLRAAAALLGTGLRPDIMYARIMDSYSTARMRLLACALGTLQLQAEGRLALMQITPQMFAQAGASPADTEDIVNEPLKSREVIASVLLIDMGDGRIRANFRSKSPEVVGYEVDVAAVAARFGGGGHRRAAGARIDGTLEQVTSQIVAAMGEAVRR